MNAYFIRGLLFGRSLCVVICSGLLQFLTRPHLWVLAALVVFSVSGAMADEVPADSVRAEPCEDWITKSSYADSQPWANKTGCTGEEAAAVGASIYFNQYQFPEDSTDHDSWVRFSSNQWSFGVSYRVCSGMLYGECIAYATKEAYDGYAIKRSDDVLYRCPPRSFPDYKIGPLEKEDGSKWCAKELGEPEQTPEEKCANYKDTIEPTKQYFFLQDATCVSGCEIKPIGDGIVYMPIKLVAGEVWDYTVGIGAFTGAVCPHGGEGGAGEVPAPSEDPVDAKPTEEKNDCQPVYNAATGVSTCTATSTSEDPGKYKCGHVNGVWTCVKVGNKTETSTAEKTSQTTTNEDGSSKTTDTVTTTTTTCIEGVCTTRTTTTTRETSKDVNGNTTGTSDKCEGDGCGPGGGSGGDSDGDGYPDAGDWYEPTEKTFESVLGEFRSRVSQAPFATAVGTFLTLHAGGNCPVWSADVPIFGTVVFDQWCGAAMGSIWPIVSAVILAVCSFFAFRIAFLK